MRTVKRRKLGSRRLDLIMGLSRANGEEILLRAVAAHCERLADPKIAALDRELKRDTDKLWECLLKACDSSGGPSPELLRFLESLFRLRVVLVGADEAAKTGAGPVARWVILRRLSR
jgi:hypothetical protein